MCTLSMQKLCPSTQIFTKYKARKATTVKSAYGPNIEIAFEEAKVLAVPEKEPTPPCLSSASSLTTEPESQ